MAEPLLDTSVFIDYLRMREEARAYIGTRVRSGRLRLHAAVACELLAGTADGRERQAVDGLIRHCRVISPSGADWVLGMQLIRTYGPAHGTDWVDCLVGASAVRLDMTVVTLNEKHFRPIRGLRVVRPY